MYTRRAEAESHSLLSEGGRVQAAVVPYVASASPLAGTDPQGLLLSVRARSSPHRSTAMPASACHTALAQGIGPPA